MAKRTVLHYLPEKGVVEARNMDVGDMLSFDAPQVMCDLIVDFTACSLDDAIIDLQSFTSFILEGIASPYVQDINEEPAQPLAYDLVEASRLMGNGRVFYAAHGRAANLLRSAAVDIITDEFPESEFISFARGHRMGETEQPLRVFGIAFEKKE